MNRRPNTPWQSQNVQANPKGISDRERKMRDLHRRYMEKRRKRLRAIKLCCAVVIIFAVGCAVSMLARNRNTSVPQKTFSTSAQSNMDTATAYVKPQTSQNTSTSATAKSTATSSATTKITKTTVQRATITDNTVTLGSTVASSNALLVRLSDHKALASKAGTEKMYPASMTKVLTLIVAYENIKDLDDTFTLTNKIIDPLYLAGASLAGFSAGETVKLRDLLYGLILPSGAEAAAALAIYVAGSEEKFVEMMNQKAKDMGLKNSHFTNCVGMHNANHYSTCVDIAYIMEYALTYPECREILMTYQYTTEPTNKHPEGVQLESTMFQRMVGDEPDGVTVLGGKTGYTDTAKNCLVSYAVSDTENVEYILVTAGASQRNECTSDTILIYSQYT